MNTKIDKIEYDNPSAIETDQEPVSTGSQEEVPF